jgi:hypothetical protein
VSRSIGSISVAIVPLLPFPPAIDVICVTDSIGSANRTHRGLVSEVLVRRHREPAKLWIAVAALVVGTIWLCYFSSLGLIGTFDRVQVLTRAYFRTSFL